MDNQNGATAVLDAVGAATDPNRAATAQDAVKLGAIYTRLSKAEKLHREAVSDFRKGLAIWTEDTETQPLEAAVEAASANLTGELIACRAIIAGLPNGVTAKGGANRQTVVMQFYGPVNRELGKRMSASDARKINSASFGG